MFGGGGGGLNPRKMKQMMEQMGIDVEELDATEVVIRTEDGDLVFDDADVTRMDARGQETYQIVGEPVERDASALAGDAEADEPAGSDAGGSTVPDADVEIVAQRADVDEATARDALKAADGDLAAAVDSLE
jgi:nascent polypeptide-associated complex subunit alpha